MEVRASFAGDPCLAEVSRSSFLHLWLLRLAFAVDKDFATLLLSFHYSITINYLNWYGKGLSLFLIFVFLWIEVERLQFYAIHSAFLGRQEGDQYWSQLLSMSSLCVYVFVFL